MGFPANYAWMASVGTLPLMITEALKLYGIHEGVGAANNPVVMSWAKEIGEEREFTADAIPWCGYFMAVVAKRAGYAFPPHPLWALNWSNFGNPAHQPCLGDVLVFVRPSGGHVGLYIAEDTEAYHVLGGNTGDAVAIARISKMRLHAVRSPAFKEGRPASSKPYIVQAAGFLSRNEA